jgi:hypothetical protein
VQRITETPATGAGNIEESDTAPAGVLAALSEDDVLGWLTQHLVAPGHLDQADLDELARIEHWNADDDAASTEPTEETTTIDRSQKARELVDRAFSAAVRVPYAAPLLALYLKHECEEAWEVSWWHEPMRLTIDAARAAWAARGASAGRTDAVLTEAALACLAVVENELLVETAAATASATRHAALAQATAAAASAARGRAEDALARLGGDEAASGILEYVRDCGEREERYYHAVAAAARAFSGHFKDGSGGDELDTAIGELLAAEEHRLIGEIDRSELRAHRSSLEILAAARERPRLRVDHGTVTYIYPFGLRGRKTSCPPGDFVQAFRNYAARWSLAGLPVQRVRRNLLLNDMWKGDDPHGRQHRGTEAMLPDLVVPDPDGGEVRLTVALRLCELGNHYLRLTAEVEDAAPPALYAAMLRPAPEFGDLEELDLGVTAADRIGAPRTWSCLAEFSTAVIDDLARRLAAELGRKAEHRGLKVEHSGRPGLYHVLVTIQRASGVYPDGEARPLQSGEDLRELLGVEPVWHPVRHGVSAIGEWLRYPVDPELAVPHPAFTGDLLVRTANSTLLGLFGSPDYMVGAVTEAAEFVATLDGLFAAWQQELSAYYRRIDGLLREMIRELEGMQPQDATAEELLEKAHRALHILEPEQLRLHQFVMASRRTLMFLSSPSLVTSPVMRVTLDRLMEAAGFDRLRTEFEGMIEEVLGGRLSTLVDTSVRRRQELHNAEADKQRARERDEQEERRRQAAARRAEERVKQDEDRRNAEKREQRQRRHAEILLAAMAGVGFAGVFQLIQAGLDHHMSHALVFALGTVLVSAVVAWWVSRKIDDDPHTTLRSADRQPDEGAADEDPRAGDERQADKPVPRDRRPRVPPG